MKLTPKITLFLLLISFSALGASSNYEKTEKNLKEQKSFDLMEVEELTEVAKSQNILAKYEKEVSKLTKEFEYFPSAGSSPLASPQIQTYSDEEYGLLATPLNKLSQFLQSSRQEAIAVAQAFEEVDIDSLLTDDTLFDFLKIIDKKKKLERLSIVLEESDKRVEQVYSEYKTWLISSPDLDELVRKHILGSYSIYEKAAFFSKASYKIKKNIAHEFIKLLDFFCKIYGTYQKGKDSLIICSNTQYVLTLNSYLQAISDLYKEEENLALQSQQYIEEMEKIAIAKPDSIPPSNDECIQSQLKYFDRLRDFSDQLGFVMNQAYNVVTVTDICSERSIFNLKNLNEKKKKIERISIFLDESEKKFTKLTSDFVEQTKFSAVLEMSKGQSEFYATAIFPNMKKSIILTQNYILELKNLIDFFLMRYGTYQKTSNENQDFRFSFQFGIDDTIYENYRINIDKLLKENKNLFVYISDLMVEFNEIE